MGHHPATHQPSLTSNLHQSQPKRHQQAALRLEQDQMFDQHPCGSSPAIPILLVRQERPATPKHSPGGFRTVARVLADAEWPPTREPKTRLGRHTRDRCDHPLAAAKGDLGGSR
jgi:hypothetical protein